MSRYSNETESVVFWPSDRRARYRTNTTRSVYVYLLHIMAAIEQLHGVDIWNEEIMSLSPFVLSLPVHHSSIANNAYEYSSVAFVNKKETLIIICTFVFYSTFFYRPFWLKFLKFRKKLVVI